MGKFEHSVRWRTRDGFKGWAYEHAPDKVWGFDDIGDGFDVKLCHSMVETDLDDDGEFTVVEEQGGVFVSVAPDGLVHRNMRDLFAVFRLRMFEPDCTESLEHLRRVLRAVAEGPWESWEALAARAFEGSVHFARAYVHWLDAERLVARMGPDAHHLVPSDEGGAVLHMLDASAPGSGLASSAQAFAFRNHRRAALARFRAGRYEIIHGCGSGIDRAPSTRG